MGRKIDIARARTVMWRMGGEREIENKKEEEIARERRQIQGEVIEKKVGDREIGLGKIAKKVEKVEKVRGKRRGERVVQLESHEVEEGDEGIARRAMGGDEI